MTIGGLREFNTAATVLTLAAGLTVLGIAGLGLARWTGHSFGTGIARRLGRSGRLGALVVAAVASLGSLSYSEVFGLRPCTLCWDQRIGMFSLVIVLGVGAIRRDPSSVWYAAPFVVIGMVASIDQLFLEGAAVPLSRRVGTNAPCQLPYFRELGFVTMSVMALCAFLLIAVLLACDLTWRPRSRARETRGASDAMLGS